MPDDLDPQATVAHFIRELQAVATPERAESEKRYLKSELQHLGATVPQIQSVCKQFLRDHPDLSREQLLALCDALWETRIHECRSAVTELLSERVALLEARDLPFVEELIRESRTWALVDPLAVDVVGDLVTRFHELEEDLDRFATDEDSWIRRTALLAHLREGEGNWNRFTRYADAMLEEKEFFVRKAIGWVLRETSKKRPDMVYEWFLPRAVRASGVTAREVLRYLSEDQRAAILVARES
jgi:3-methyladenine DNA glycosylase AlkD